MDVGLLVALAILVLAGYLFWYYNYVSRTGDMTFGPFFGCDMLELSAGVFHTLVVIIGTIILLLYAQGYFDSLLKFLGMKPAL